MCAHVGQQVVDDLTQAVLVPRHLERRGRPELHGPIRPHRGRGADGFGHERHELDGSELHGDTLIEPGQRQEVVDEPVHACRLGADAGDHPRQVGLVGGGATFEELCVGRHRGDGRAQLVRCVGHEATQVFLRFLGALLGRHPGRERRLDALEHDVEGPGQATDLGGLVGARHALVEVACGDRLRRGLDVLEGAETEADQPPAAGQSQDECPGGDGELGQEKGVQGARLIDQRLSEDGNVILLLDRSHTERRAIGVDGACGEVDLLRAVRLASRNP